MTARDDYPRLTLKLPGFYGNEAILRELQLEDALDEIDRLRERNAS